MNTEFELLPPLVAIEETQEARDFWKGEGRVYPEAWLIIAVGAGISLFVDCELPGAVSPLHLDFDLDPDFNVAPSLGAMFTYWTELIVDGDEYWKLGLRWLPGPNARNATRIPDTAE